MIHNLTYILQADAKDIFYQLESRLSLVGIQTRHLRSSDKYSYFEASWDDAEVPDPHLKGSRSRNAGAKPKQLIYNGEPVTCGSIFQLRNVKNLSDAEIGMIFDVSESTIARRRKKHLSDGSFYKDSTIIF